MGNEEAGYDYGRNVQLARVWLRGFSVMNGDIRQDFRYEDGTREDADCRRALAQLLADGNAPREILHLLATLVAPDLPPSKESGVYRVGEQVFVTGDPHTALSLIGSEWTVNIRRRCNRRYPDIILQGSIAHQVSRKRRSGMNLENACREVSAEAKAAGVKKMSPENVRRIWSRLKGVIEPGNL